MSTQIDRFSIKTISSNYSWDKTIPNQALVEDALLQGNTFIGYAPYVHVSLSATLSGLTPRTIAVFRETDFGDFYNSETNSQTTTLSGSYKFCHAYIMPGTYKISLNHTQYINISNLQTSAVYIEPGTETIKVRPPFAWMWNKFTQIYQETPDYSSTLELGNECVTWDDVSFQGPKQTTWEYAKGPALSFDTAQVPISAKSIHQDFPFYIQVLEIPPTAVLTNAKSETEQERVSPYEALLTARHSRCGSFPIERIIWDFGDGSPTLEISRFNVKEMSKFLIYNNTFQRDYSDPRNFDVSHTYTRTKLNTSLFYPSITAFASSTGKTSCASSVIGPLKFKPLSNFNILQNSLKQNKKGYIGEINSESIGLWNTNK